MEQYILGLDWDFRWAMMVRDWLEYSVMGFYRVG